VVAAMTAPVLNSRWIQDRQNFVSIFHEKRGLVLGGGNTKLQPSWSNFTVGDLSTFFHKPGDEDPNFLPPPGLLHVPIAARVLEGAEFGVELTYGKHVGRIVVDAKNANELELKLSGDSDMAAHVTLLPRFMGKPTSEPAPFTRTKSGIEMNGVGISLPADASVRWPLFAHDPYKKDGKATLDEARVVIDTPSRSTLKLVIY